MKIADALDFAIASTVAHRAKNGLYLATCGKRDRPLNVNVD
jgi:hypothetical protein